MKQSIFIAGAGGIGRAAALMILESTYLDVQVVLGDADEDTLQTAKDWIQSGTMAHKDLDVILMPRSGSSEELIKVFQSASVLLDCLPGSLAPTMAKYCLDHEMHYANLTEYVAETDAIMSMAQDAKTGFILQTGLAPGYIDVLGVELINRFKALHPGGKIRNLRLRVGALSENARDPHYYAFTWSPIGVATEYVKESVVVQDGVTKKIPSLSEREQLILQGKHYEADYTSGGIADLPQALGNEVSNINYKTIRYPGHYDWVLANLKGHTQDDINTLEAFMLDNIPTVENDIVLVYAEVDGHDASGRLYGINEILTIKPMRIGDHTLRAIQTTTAAPLIECARLLLQGKYRGVVTQSMLDPMSFLNGPIVSQVYGKV